MSARQVEQIQLALERAADAIADAQMIADEPARAEIFRLYGLTLEVACELRAN